MRNSDCKLYHAESHTNLNAGRILRTLMSVSTLQSSHHCTIYAVKGNPANLLKSVAKLAARLGNKPHSKSVTFLTARSRLSRHKATEDVMTPSRVF